MDENTNVSMSDGEVGTFADISDDAILSDWNGASPSVEDEETTDEQPNADPQDADEQENDTKPADGEAEPEKTDTEPKPEDNQTFKLKYLGQEIEVARDEVVTLAQKGKDYDRVREKYDALKADIAKTAERDESLEHLAKEMGVTTDELVDSAWLSFFKNKGYDDDTARDKVEIAKEKRVVAREKAAKEQAEKDKQAEAEAKAKDEQRKKEDASKFIQTFPDFKGDKLPDDVIRAVANGESLVTAYALHQLKSLQAEIAAMKQNAANAAKTTGSKASAGNKKDIDPFVESWYKD